jgi:hypothetical protein
VVSLIIAKYLQALKALIAANRISLGNAIVTQRTQKLKQRVETIDIRDELREVFQREFKEVGTVQNGSI